MGADRTRPRAAPGDPARPPVDVVARLRAAGCVYAEDEARLIFATAGTPADAAAMVEQRATGLPLEHVLGWARFCGLRVAVDPGVFVPRRRSEFLARTARRFVGDGAVVVDLCCGTGALGLAVVTGIAGAELHAADADPAAVACARRNLGSVGGQVHLGDLDAPLPQRLRGRVDVLLASPPYVPTDAIALLPPEARQYEPRTALDGGADGLDVARRIAAAAPAWLAPAGVLLLETGGAQVPAALAAVEAAGLVASVRRHAGLDATVVLGRRAAGSPGTSPRAPGSSPSPRTPGPSPRAER